MIHDYSWWLIIIALCHRLVFWHFSKCCVITDDSSLLSYLPVWCCSLRWPCMVWTVCAGYFFGRIGGATTFASAKVKNAIGRIGIFIIQKALKLHVFERLFACLYILTETNILLLYYHSLFRPFVLCHSQKSRPFQQKLEFSKEKLGLHSSLIQALSIQIKKNVCSQRIMA